MIIITGRFQPFHNGHLSLLNEVVKRYPNEFICIAIIKDIPHVKEKNDFDKIADQHFVDDKNPFNSSFTIKMIKTIISKRKYKNVCCTFMPKSSEEIWPVICSLFDEKRYWVIPKVNDDPKDWENVKANFYSLRNDEVIRIEVNKTINATEIRKAILDENWHIVKMNVPKIIYRMLKDRK